MDEFSQSNLTRQLLQVIVSHTTRRMNRILCRHGGKPDSAWFNCSKQELDTMHPELARLLMEGFHFAANIASAQQTVADHDREGEHINGDDREIHNNMTRGLYYYDESEQRHQISRRALENIVERLMDKVTSASLRMRIDAEGQVQMLYSVAAGDDSITLKKEEEDSDPMKPERLSRQVLQTALSSHKRPASLTQPISPPPFKSSSRVLDRTSPPSSSAAPKPVKPLHDIRDPARRLEDCEKMPDTLAEALNSQRGVVTKARLDLLRAAGKLEQNG